MAVNADSVGGEFVGRQRGHVVSFPTGRMCAEAGCRTRLSVYNSRPKCAVHDFDASLMNFRSPLLPDTTKRAHVRARHHKAKSAA